MASGAVTVKQTYGTSQTDTVLHSPASSKSMFIWNCILTTTEAGTATVKFATSGNVIATINGIGSLGVNGVNMEGAVDEDIAITCPAGTTVITLTDDLS